MDWQSRKPDVWPEPPGVMVLEAEPGEARDAVVAQWLADRGQAGATARLLQCTPERGGIWAGGPRCPSPPPMDRPGSRRRQ